MLDNPDGHDEEKTYDILLAQVGDAYWLLEGDEHLDALLANDKPYPAPVHCIRFPSMFELTAMLPEGQGTGALWSIHPGIIQRLKRKDELLVVDLPETD